MERRCLKTVVLVELLGAVVQCVYQQGSNTCILRNRCRSVHCVLQHGTTQLETPGTVIDGQSGENHHRNGVRHVAAYGACGGLVRDSACHSTFSANRERLFNEDLARAFLTAITTPSPPRF